MRTLKLCGGTNIDISLLRHYPILQLGLQTLVKEDIALFWNTICTVIEEHLKANKGVILAGIGNFTYITKQRQIGRDSIRCTKEPIFIISDKLATSNWLRRPPVYFDELVPSHHLNFFLLSNFMDTDNCKLRQCYAAILARLQHFIMIRKPFVLPFPGVGKLVFRGNNYWFKYNNTLLATQRFIYATNGHRGLNLGPSTSEDCDMEVTSYPCKMDAYSNFTTNDHQNRKKKSTVGRSMEVANRIKESAFRRCLDERVFADKRRCTVPQTAIQRDGKVPSDSFVISYPKPCLGKGTDQQTSIPPRRHDPSPIFAQDFTRSKKKRKCVHQGDYDTCPATAHIQDDTMNDRLKAGEDKIKDEAASFGPSVRRAMDEATANFRKQRAERKYTEDEKKEALIVRHNYDEYARNIKERKEMLRHRRLEAREYDLVNKDLLKLREELKRSQNDFTNQFVFPGRAESPPWRIGKERNEEAVQIQRECRAKRKQLALQKHKEDSVKIRKFLARKYKVDAAEENRIGKEKIVKQKKMLDAMDGRTLLLHDVKGEYFEIPQVNLNKHRQICKERRKRDARENCETCIARKMEAQQERAIIRAIEANLTKEIDARAELKAEQRNKEMQERKVSRFEDMRRKNEKELRQIRAIKISRKSK